MDDLTKFIYKKGGGSRDGALLRYGVQMILIVTK